MHTHERYKWKLPIRIIELDPFRVMRHIVFTSSLFVRTISSLCCKCFYCSRNLPLATLCILGILPQSKLYVNWNFSIVPLLCHCDSLHLLHSSLLILAKVFKSCTASLQPIPFISQPYSCEYVTASLQRPVLVLEMSSINLPPGVVLWVWVSVFFCTPCCAGLSFPQALLFMACGPWN